MLKKLSPMDGGCWFCSTEVKEGDNSLFSGEFDTNLHKTCLEESLEKDPSHPEARIIAREFDMTLPVIPDNDIY